MCVEENQGEQGSYIEIHVIGIWCSAKARRKRSDGDRPQNEKPPRLFKYWLQNAPQTIYVNAVVSELRLSHRAICRNSNAQALSHLGANASVASALGHELGKNTPPQLGP